MLDVACLSLQYLLNESIHLCKKARKIVLPVEKLQPHPMILFWTVKSTLMLSENL